MTRISQTDLARDALYTKVNQIADEIDAAKPDDNTVVHLTGDETIGGAKTFQNSLEIKGSVPDLYIMNSSADKGIVTSQKREWRIANVDKNGESIVNSLGTFATIFQSGKTVSYMGAYKAQSGSSELASIAVYYPASGLPYTAAPSSDENGSIVTTVDKNKDASGYFKFGNGMIVQWGSVEFSSQVATITFPTAFSNTNYKIVAMRGAGATTTNDGGQIYRRGGSTTTTNLYATSTNTGGCMWIAIGY